MILEKEPSTKEDLLKTILAMWNHFDEEYCFKFVKFMPERVTADIKSQGQVNDY